MDFFTKKENWLGIGGCILVIIGCFLPFASALGISASWFNGDGKIVIVAALIAGILMFFKKAKFSLIPTVIVALIFALDVVNIFKSEYKLSCGIGTFVVFIGLICMIVYPFISKKD